MADEAAKLKPARNAVVSGADPRIIGAYKRMLISQFIGTVGLVAVLALILLAGFVSPNWSPPLLLLVVLAGMLGAFFSALTRLYHVDQAGAALITPTLQGLGGWYMIIYATVPPVIGAIAALVLYMLFVSGLVQGDLFPEIDCVKGTKCDNIANLMKNYWPVEPSDYGKALVWSFVAGFSERFVPDLLQTLVKKDEKKAKG